MLESAKKLGISGLLIGSLAVGACTRAPEKDSEKEAISAIQTRFAALASLDSVDGKINGNIESRKRENDAFLAYIRRMEPLKYNLFLMRVQALIISSKLPTEDSSIQQELDKLDLRTFYKQFEQEIVPTPAPPTAPAIPAPAPEQKPAEPEQEPVPAPVEVVPDLPSEELKPTAPIPPAPEPELKPAAPEQKPAEPKPAIPDKFVDSWDPITGNSARKAGNVDGWNPFNGNNDQPEWLFQRPKPPEPIVVPAPTAPNPEAPGSEPEAVVITNPGATLPAPTKVPQAGLDKGESGLTDADIDKIYAKAAPSTVRLTLRFSDNELSSCSGYMIAPGVIATARHCQKKDHGQIQGVTVEWPAEFNAETGEITAVYITEGRTVGFSNEADTAFIALPKGIDGPASLTEGKIRKGHSVAFIGHPQGLSWITSTGRISEIISSGTGRLRFSQAGRPGNSGGPVLNGNGEVVGTLVYGDVGENSGFAVPIETTVEVLRDIEKKGWINQARELGSNIGVLKCGTDLKFNDFSGDGHNGTKGQTISANDGRCELVDATGVRGGIINLRRSIGRLLFGQ